ncbi:MAG: Trp biosynthesis-associated membrane protein, partial [Nonomuraea sp.]|nr:Trp biosynthesis-associated membrane protein [Nonomuraea sp.]
EPVPAWPVVAGLGAVLLLAGGVFAALRGRGWAGMSARYDRGGAGEAPSRRVHEDRELWDALDRGDDPTESADVR